LGPFPAKTSSTEAFSGSRCYQSLYANSYFGWATTQSRHSFASIPCRGPRKKTKKEKSGPKNDENRQKWAKMTKNVKNTPRVSRPNSRHSNFEITSSRPHTTSNYTASSSCVLDQPCLRDSVCNCLGSACNCKNVLVTARNFSVTAFFDCSTSGW
jgi:hypothetical protein